MTFAQIAPLLGVWLIAVVAPGPDFIAVLRVSAARGRAQGMAVAGGVICGIACWAMLAMAGLGALLTRYAHVYAVIRAVGAAFLLAYGARILWHAWRARTGESGHSGEVAAISVGSLGSAWRLGLATNLANPKAVAFFGALFASLLPAGLSTAARAEVVLALLFMALTWLVAVAWTASTGRVAAAYQRGRRAIDAVTGGVLAGVGLALFPR